MTYHTRPPNSRPRHIITYNIRFLSCVCVCGGGGGGVGGGRGEEGWCERGQSGPDQAIEMYLLIA